MPGSVVGTGARSRMTDFVATLRRLARGRLLALAPAVLPACYYYVPMQTAPASGVEVEITLNDTGRVGMTSAVGPEVGSIQGVLASVSDSALVLHVTQVLGEYGGVTKWNGEVVTIRPDYVRTLRERKFSASRTVVLAALAGGGLVAFAASQNLLGIGGAPGNSGPGGNGGTKSQ